MLIGLTGKYCAGKNTVAALLEKRGVSVLDVDKLGHQALEIEKETIFAQFGNNLRKADGSLDRQLLGQKVFGNPKKLKTLEDTIHPIADRLVEEWIDKEKNEKRKGEKVTLSEDSTSLTPPSLSSLPTTHYPLIINAALLHRSSVFNKLDRIIMVKAPFLTRLLRARKRDKLPWLDLVKRFASQRNFNTQYLAVNAEIHIVKNKSGSDSDLRKLENQIDKFLKGI